MTMTLSEPLRQTGEALADRAVLGDTVGPAETIELANHLKVWAKRAQMLETMAGACAATMAAAELAAIETRSTDR